MPAPYILQLQPVVGIESEVTGTPSEELILTLLPVLQGATGEAGADLSSSVSSISSGLSSTNSTISTISSGLSETSDTVVSVVSSLSSTNNVVSSISSGLSSTNTYISNGFSNTNSAVSSVSSGLSNVSTSLSNTNSSVSSISSGLSNTNSVVSTVSSGLSTINSSVSSISSSLSTTTSSMSSVSSGLSIVQSTQSSISSGLNNVKFDLNEVASLTERSVSLSNPTNIVSQASAANLANPNVTDSLLPTFADQLWRVYNSGTGLLSSQSSSTLGTFGVTRKYPVTAGNTYTISMHGAPSDFIFYFSGTPTITFYNAGGTFVTGLTTFTSSYGSRELTFTVPASCAKVAFNIRDSVNFSNTAPMDSTSLQSCVNNIMLNAGSSALPFSAYNTGAYAPSAALFAESATGNVIVAKQGYYIFIRAVCQMSTDTDVVWRVLYGRPPNYNLTSARTGAVDFTGIRFIPRATNAANTIAEFNKSTHIHNQGTDEGSPVKFNSMFLGGTGHGAVGYAATKTGHDKTNVDVGSTWSDGVSTWVLTYIQDANNVLFIRKYTGAVDKWTIGTGIIAGSTLTHVAGATHTSAYAFTAQPQQQLIPSIKDIVNLLSLDGVAITADGVYLGYNVRMRELYSIINPASEQDALIAAVGTASPNYTAGTEQIRCFNEYSWNDCGAMEVRAGRGVIQAFNRNAGTPPNYWGGIQLQRISQTSDVPKAGLATACNLYIPDISTVSGYNFQSIANITANATTVLVPKSSCANTSDPASHFALLGTASGITTSGHLYGVNRAEGLGIPANRAASIANVMYFSSANKNYVVLIDSTQATSTVGDSNVATLFRAPFLPTDSDLTVPAVVVTMSGVDYVYITAHKNLTNKSIQVPTRLSGRKITVVKPHANVTVIDSHFTNSQVTINVTNAYGDIILKAG